MCAYEVMVDLDVLEGGTADLRFDARLVISLDDGGLLLLAAQLFSAGCGCSR
jgi:hypothetical protein